MADSFIDDIETYFDDIIESFDAVHLAAGTVNQYQANSGQLANTNQTFHRPVQMFTEVQDGRDLTGQEKDLTELTVPSTLVENHIRNVYFDLAGVELNNQRIRERAAKAASLQLSAKLDTLVANKIADDATLLVKNSGNIDTYDDLAEAEAIMSEQQMDQGERCIFLNPRMATNIAGNLAGRGTMQGFPVSAYTSSEIPQIANFSVFRNQYMKSITGSTGSGYLVNGADQDYTPLTHDANGIPVDNRTSILTVDTGSNATVGDFFTIAGVNSIGHINKEDTGELKTFRIKAINGANWTVSPAIVPADGTAQAQKDYATCSTTPADNAAITILNTTTKKCSAFFQKDAVEIIKGDYNLEDFNREGKLISKSVTDSGIPIALLSESSVPTLTSRYRLMLWANVEVLQPEAVGLYLEGQA
jgi:hypothetical protein